MKLADFLRTECILASAEIPDKAAALRAVADLAKQSPILADVSAEEILRGLEERETLGSTGFGNGIALPHCRLESVTEFVVGLITVPTTLDFDAVDGMNVSLIVFTIGPRRAPNRYLRVLSRISLALIPHGNPDVFLGHTSSVALRDSFLETVDLDIDTVETASMSGIFVIVQDEAIFGDLIHAMVPVTLGSLLVLDTEPAEAYLPKIPLFASFLGDQVRSFGKILFAFVDRGLVNEALRAIEGVTGDLSKRTGVMVAVQDYNLTAGSLEPPD